MNIKELAIGEKITGTFSFNTEFEYKDVEYKFLVDSDELILIINNKKIKLDYDKNDANSRNFVSMFTMQQNPIARIVRKYKNKLFVELFLYEDVIIIDNLVLYYSPEIPRRLEGLMIAQSISQFMEDEFFLKDNIFASVSKNKDILIIGKNYEIKGIFVNDSTIRIEKIVKKRKRNYNFKISNILYNSKEIFNQDEYMRHNISSSSTLVTPKSTTRYIKYWKEYLKLEKNEAILNIIDNGTLKFMDYKIKVDHIEFKIDPEFDSNLSRDNIGKEFLSYYSNPTYELLNVIDEGNKTKIRRSEVREDMHLEFNSSSELMLGAVKEISKNYIRVYYNRDFIFKIEKMPKKGYISLSFMGSKKNFERKESILKSLRDKEVSFLKNIILYGTAQGLENTSKRLKKVTTASMYEDMFGTKEMKPTETQREALKIALSTPDIALIQGPPGTGKTTIIRGIISRLKSISDYIPKILVSSEQHEALGNVIDGVQTMLPPTVISKKFSETDEDLYSKISRFQEQIRNDFEKILSTEEFKDENKELLIKLTQLKNQSYSKEETLAIIDDVSSFVMGKGEGINRFNRALFRLQNVVKRVSSNHRTYKDEFLEVLLDGCRLTKNSFKDDGLEQLDNLLVYLSMNPIFSVESLTSIRNELELKMDDVVFNRYLEIVKEMKSQNVIESNIGEEKDTYEVVITELFAAYDDYINSTQYSSYSRVLNDTLAEILNPKLLTTTVAKYNSIFGSTCQQAVNFTNGRSEIKMESKFDYVIIDEASRVNPIDLIIPMTMGNKIILVGDQKQLPHYLERQNVKKLAKHKNVKNDVLDEVLRESLFSRIFNLVKEAHLSQDTSVKRYITLNEQYRMNSVLGSYISNEFYKGSIVNGFGVDQKTNDYGIANDKLIAWYDIPKSKGFEVNTSTGSKSRMVEVDKIRELVKYIIDKFSGDLVDLPSIGIMSYYKGQTETIRSVLENNFTDTVLDNIFIGTVDSFQGKEFDIVLLSTTRSNNEEKLRKRVGFMSNSPNRINVSMSRAKNLMVVVGDAQTICGDENSKVIESLYNYLALCKEEGYYEEV